MTRGVARDAALTAQPARKGRRAGQAVRYRDLSLTRARRRLILAAVRSGRASYKALTSQVARFRTVTDRNRHRARKSKSPSTFGHAGPKDTATRTATAVITMANKPVPAAEIPPAAPESRQNNTAHPAMQRKPGRRKHAGPAAAAPGNRRTRNVTKKETTHQGINA